MSSEYGYLRRDDVGQWMLIPEDEIDEYDELRAAYERATHYGDMNMLLANRLDYYMVEYGLDDPYDLLVLIE